MCYHFYISAQFKGLDILVNLNQTFKDPGLSLKSLLAFTSRRFVTPCGLLEFLYLHLYIYIYTFIYSAKSFLLTYLLIYFDRELLLSPCLSYFLFSNCSIFTFTSFTFSSFSSSKPPFPPLQDPLLALKEISFSYVRSYVHLLSLTNSLHILLETNQSYI